MKKSILFIGALLMILGMQAQRKVKGNGNVKTITRTTSDYDAIFCGGSFDYILVSGTEGKITLEGEENILEHIITEVKGGKLHVRTENNMSLRTSNGKNVKITIPFKDVSEVSMAGSGNMWTENKITANDFKTSMAGSGSLTLEVDAQSVDADMAGSGKMKLRGKTNELKAEVAGSGNFNGSDLQASNTDVSVAGSGGADVFCTDNLRARVAGSGDIKYKGNPKQEDTKVAGSGSISN